MKRGRRQATKCDRDQLDLRGGLMTTKAAKPATTTKAAKPAPKRATTSNPPTRARRRTPDHSEICERAYFIHLEEGRTDDLENWLRAERELQAA
jgi:hypothetical protein